MAPQVYDGPSIFHVGYIKTATTFLQNSVFSNESLGCTLGAGRTSRSYLVDWFVTSDAFSYDPAQVDEQIADHEAESRAKGLVPIWSDEALLGEPIFRSYHGWQAMERIASLSRPKKVIISIREQRSMARSVYKEYVFQGGRNTLTEVIGTGQEPRSFTSILRPDYLYYDRIAAWAFDKIGRDNVLFLPIELLRKDPDKYFETLFGFLGYDVPDEVPTSPVYVGGGAASLALHRVLNYTYTLSPLTPKRPFGYRMTKRIVRRIDAVTPKSLDQKIDKRWRAEIDARYEGVFAEGNRRFEELTGLNLRDYGYQ